MKRLNTRRSFCALAFSLVGMLIFGCGAVDGEMHLEESAGKAEHVTGIPTTCEMTAKSQDEAYRFVLNTRAEEPTWTYDGLTHQLRWQPVDGGMVVLTRLEQGNQQLLLVEDYCFDPMTNSIHFTEDPPRLDDGTPVASEMEIVAIFETNEIYQ